MSDSEQSLNVKSDVNKATPNFNFGQFFMSKWFLVIFESIATWHDFSFGQIFKWIGSNNDRYIYDFLESRLVILSNVWTDSQQDLILPLVNFSY